ncbi:hypothetical protein ACSFA8_00150 [Variovorax sp. RT4R15]
MLLSITPYHIAGMLMGVNGSVAFIDALPTTGAGKVLRRLLK